LYYVNMDNKIDKKGEELFLRKERNERDTLRPAGLFIVL
jgi:hypothetical protein